MTQEVKYFNKSLKDILKLVGLTAIATLPGGFIVGALIKLFKAEYLVTPSSFVNEVGEANLQPYKLQNKLSPRPKHLRENLNPRRNEKSQSDRI